MSFRIYLGSTESAAPAQYQPRHPGSDLQNLAVFAKGWAEDKLSVLWRRPDLLLRLGKLGTLRNT